MATIGVSFEGVPHFRFKERDNGYLVPDVSVAELNERHRETLRNQVEASSELDELGYDYIVNSEHHSSLLGMVSPHPLLTQTAMARETRDVRLLQMANILPWHEPFRLAEQLSMLDVLSDGRVDVGVGQGSSDLAAETLGQYWGGTTEDRDENWLSFEEKYEILRKAWEEPSVSHRGEFHRIPPRYDDATKDVLWYQYLDDEVSESEPEAYLSESDATGSEGALPVLPQPQQSPHPQLWKPALSPDAAEWAAHRGMNVCTHVHRLSDTKEVADAYYGALEDAGWPDRRPEYDGRPLRRGWDERSNRGLGVIVVLFNTDVVDEETERRWKRAMKYTLIAKSEGGDSDADSLDEPDVEGYLDEGDMPIVGGTEEIIDQLDHLRRACEFEDVFFIVDTNNFALTHEERLEQLRAFATDVAPYFEEVVPTTA